MDGTTPIGMQDLPEPPGVDVGRLFNYLTGETYILNDYLSNDINYILPEAWSADGRHILMSADIGRHIVTLEVLDAQGNWQTPTWKSGATSGIAELIGWLDVEDLVLVRRGDETANEEVYFIAQIVDDALLMTEFFRLPIDEFTNSPSSYIPKGSWHLAADAEERAVLSCLFGRSPECGDARTGGCGQRRD